MRDSGRAVGRIIALLALLFICLQAPVANPFMGAQDGANGKQSRQASPVRAAPGDRNLVAKQASLRDALGNYFYSWKESGSRALFWGIMGVSFLYGILHALGPGHRKTVIFSLYLARKAPPWEPAGTGALLAILHAGAAVVLLLALRGVSGAISG
ncbi:MAG TPA: hypothetical protein PK542_09530, partial [Treponemataceae bacterium]|nr:hypothetical protein [Treponemataceae bacterium]